MLPASRVRVRTLGEWAEPLWLGAEDHAWLSALIGDFVRLEGRGEREAEAFLEEPSRVAAPEARRQMALWTWRTLCGRERPPVDGRRLRALLFPEAERARRQGGFDRESVIAAVARRLRVGPGLVEPHLFSDLASRRPLGLPDPLPTPHDLALRTNLELAQGVLGRASEAMIRLHGAARAVMRQVHLRRLLASVHRAGERGFELRVSGPLALFHHTSLYGRSLASVLPLLLRSERFELEALCRLGGEEVRVRIRSGDPLPMPEAPPGYDSGLEERFARDFLAATLDWDLLREPEPVEAGGALTFPDFALIHRRDPARRFLLEIVGFWTPDYLRAKLDRLGAMKREPFVLCIDRRLDCAAGDLPPHARLVPFSRRIDPLKVLEAIETGSGERS